jgi:hypothetical protein
MGGQTQKLAYCEHLTVIKVRTTHQVSSNVMNTASQGSTHLSFITYALGLPRLILNLKKEKH